jgi:flagellar secretion chaperone FliS
MTVSSRSSNLAAYQMAATHGGVAAADPQRLVVMLMDGALTRIAQARGCTERRNKAERLTHLNKALALVAELRASLDMNQGTIAENLDSLYDYMTRQLLKAHVGDDVAPLDEVSRLLQEIRGAWTALPPTGRAALVPRAELR